MLVLFLPHVGWREFLTWDVQIGPVILGEAPLTTSWWDPAICHELSVNVNNLGCDPLSTSEPCFLATVFPNSTLSPHKYLPVFLVIFVRTLTTKITESCSFKSWFIWG
jgi:hypothetical protein